MSHIKSISSVAARILRVQRQSRSRIFALPIQHNSFHLPPFRLPSHAFYHTSSQKMSPRRGGFKIQIGGFESDGSLPEEDAAVGAVDEDGMLCITHSMMTKEGIEAVLNDASNLAQTKIVVLVLSKDPFASMYDEPDLPDEEVYQLAIKSLHRFANLYHVELVFSSTCTHPDPSKGWEAWETADFRFEVLNNLFAALNNAENPVSNLISLSIQNLQNLIDTRLTSSKNFIATISRLKELRLKIVTEEHEHAPETAWHDLEVYDFCNKFPNTWLKPTQANLTSLTLQCDEYWGYMPKLELRGLHFPKLQYLEFQNLVFSHDW